jgi:PAS domain S-box-containing protein
VASLSVAIATTGLAIATGLWIRRASQAARMRETALRTELDDIRRQFLTLSGLLNDAFLLVDRSGRIIDANDRAAETYGYTIEELRDLAIFDLGVPSAVAQAREQMEQIVAQGGLRFETAHRRRDASTAFPVEVSARAIRGRTGDLYYCVVRDLSELTRLHTQLAFADRMASVGTLAAGVAHEINNPLAYVLANIGYAEEELAGLQCDEVKQALTDAREGARRVRQIVLDLKAFAREDERAPGATDVGEAVRFALSLVQNEVRHRARLEVDVGEIPAVRGSEHRIGQVLVNLLVNAAHAIPPGRASENLIAITARQAADGDVEISVRDTGMGIAAEVLPRIFDPFFTTKPIGSGTGLGLAVCHGIVAQLGGRLRVESTVGEGSTFRVVLPAALEPANEPAVEEADAESDAAPLLARARVLVIDDEPLVASSVARVLGSTCVVESAHDATAALSWAAVSRYDLVLCDLMMPDVSGAEFYAALLAKSPELAHRTVFLTGGAFTDEAQAFLSCVNPPVVPKPFEPQQLRLAIARALSPARETAAA